MAVPKHRKSKSKSLKKTLASIVLGTQAFDERTI